MTQLIQKKPIIIILLLTLLVTSIQNSLYINNESLDENFPDQIQSLDQNFNIDELKEPLANPYHPANPDWLEDGYDYDNYTFPLHFQEKGFIVPGKWVGLNTHKNLSADGADFYAFDASAGDSIRVTICGEEGAELTLQWISSSDGSVNAESTIEYEGSFGFCSLELNAITDREFIICVNASGLWNDQYNLEILVNGNAGYTYRDNTSYYGQAITPDWLEDGYDFDNYTNPLHLQDSGFVVPGRWNDLNLHKNQTFDYPDNYAFDAKAGDNVKILLFTEVDCDIAIQLVDGTTGNVLSSSSMPVYGVCSLEIDVMSDETLVFCINSSTGEWQHFYDMAIILNDNVGHDYQKDASYSGQATLPDWLEDGYDFDNFTVPLHFQGDEFVVPGRWNDLNLHKNQTFDYPDYYAFDAKAGDNVKIQLFTEVDCDIAIQQVDGTTGNVLSSSSMPLYGVCSLEIDVISDETLVICINSSTGEWQHFYDMAIMLNDNIGYVYEEDSSYIGQATFPDWLEDGYDFDNYTEPLHLQDSGFVVPGRWNDLNLHNNQTFDYPDYYTFDAKAGDNVKILLFSEVDCDIAIQHVDGTTGNVLSSSAMPIYGVCSLEIDAISDETIVICINSSTGEWQHFYDMALMFNDNIGYENSIEFISEPESEDPLIDIYEYNDDIANAYPIMVNTNYTGIYMQNQEVDWFKVNLTEGYAYHIDMVKNGAGAIFMLYDSEGTEIAHSSEIIQYHRNIQINICKNDTYYLKFIGEMPEDEIATLGLCVYEDNWGFNMTYEFGPSEYENNDDIANAYPIMVNTNYYGIYMQNQEVNWFKVNLTKGFGYHIDMVKNGAGAIFMLYDSEGTEIAHSSEIIQYHRNIQINICKNDTYYLKFIGEMPEDDIATLGLCVYEDNWGFNMTYEFGPDKYEYNDDMANAYPLEVNMQYAGIYMQNRSVDWYKVNLSEGYSYHIDMTKNGAGAYFILYDSEGTQIAHSSEIIQYHRNIQVNIFKNETYFIQFVGEMPEDEIATLGIYIYETFGHNSEYTDDDTTDDDTTDDDTTDDDTTDDDTTDNDTTDDDTTDDDTTDDDTTDDDTTDDSDIDNPFEIPGYLTLGLIMISVFALVLIGKKTKVVKM